MFDFSKYLQFNYLSRYVHLPVDVQNVLAGGLILVGLVMDVYFLVLFLGKDDRIMNYRVLRIGLLVLSVLEIAVYHLCPDANQAGGFLPKDPFIWVILTWALIGVLFVSQCVMVPHLLEGNGVRTRRYSSAGILKYGAVLFGVSMVASFLVRSLWPYCGLIGLGTLALQVLSDLVATIRNRSSFLAFLWNAVWMLICSLAIMLWSTKLLPLFLFLYFVFTFLEGLLHSGEASCASCRTFRDGYCHLHRDYRSSSDYCDRWEQRR